MNHVASIKFSPSDLQTCVEMLESDQYKSLRVETEVSGVSGAPEAPSRQQQDVIDDFGDSLPRAARVRAPWWCRHMCAHRDLFHDTALGSGDPDSAFFFS